MAVTHHRFLVHTTEVFSCPVVETKTNQIVSQHNNLRAVLDKAERNVETAATALPRDGRPVETRRCGYQDDRYELPCGAPATVTDMETGCTFCPSHFREVIL